MPDQGNQIFEALSRNPLFRLLGEDVLRDWATNPRTAAIRKGQIIYDVGDSCNGFFIVLSGKVALEKENAWSTTTLSLHELGDFFGSEMFADSSRKRLTRAVALEDCTLIKFSRADLHEMAAGCEEFKQAAKLEHRSYLYQVRKKLPWKNETESVVYISRKHKYLLFRALFFPLLFGVILLFPLAGIYFVSLPGQIVMPVLMVFVLVVSILWAIWKGWDWTNDYYVVTDQRLLNLEKVVMFYESRQETPLAAILSVETGTSVSGRWMGFGTVRVRTYTGAIEFEHIENPEWVVTLLQEFWSRAKRSQFNISHAEVEEDIRQRIAGNEPASSQLPVSPIESNVESGPLVNSLSDFFKLREVEGDTIIFRTHWWKLIRRLFLPMLLLFLWIGSLAAVAAGLLSGLDMTLFFAIVILSGLFLWLMFLYRIVDWRNDFYMITADQIIDVHRRPLGSEDKRSAPLKNIQTIEYTRLGLLGILLNFGTVFVRIGDTDFTFDYISDPSSVQKELFERFMALTQREKKNDIRAERERIADYIDTYHRMTGETLLEENQADSNTDSE